MTKRQTGFCLRMTHCARVVVVLTLTRLNQVRGHETGYPGTEELTEELPQGKTQTNKRWYISTRIYPS